MKNQKKNFKFTKKHFTICTVIFALLILFIYGTYIQIRDRNLKDANKSLTCKENIPSSHYHWPDEKLERTNSWTYSDPGGKFTATTTYLANDTSRIHLKRVTKYAKTGKKVTEYGALVMPHMSHSKEVFSVINESGEKYFGTEQSNYKRYGTSVPKTELSISERIMENESQDGTRFLFWSDKPKGDFKFVGIVSISHIKPSAADDDHTSRYVRNIAYSFGAPEVTKVKGAAQYATWAYADTLLYFEVPSDKDHLTTTELVLSMNKDNQSSIKIAQRLGFKQGTKDYSYSNGRDERITNENMDIYVMSPDKWQQKYNVFLLPFWMKLVIGGIISVGLVVIAATFGAFINLHFGVIPHITS